MRSDLIGAATAAADSILDDVRASLVNARARDALHRHKAVSIDAGAALALLEAVDRMRAGQAAAEPTGNIGLLVREADRRRRRA